MLLWLANLGNAGGTASAPVFSGTIEDISLEVDSGSTDYDFSTYFISAASYSISPSVEAGWSFNTSTGVLTVLPGTVGVFGDYVVTGTNGVGSDDSNSFSVTVTALPDDDATGGFWYDYDLEYRKREDERKERERLLEEAKQIQDRIDRELALEFRKQDAEQSRIKELQRLTKLADKQQRFLKENLSELVFKSAERAIRQGNYSAMESFERQIRLAREEELFLIEALEIVLNA